MQNEQSIWKNLEKALDSNSSLDTLKYLTLWLADPIQGQQATLAQSLKCIENKALIEAVNTLLASRYSKSHGEWQSTALHQILRKLRKEGNVAKKTKHDLSPLYPDT